MPAGSVVVTAVVILSGVVEFEVVFRDAVEAIVSCVVVVVVVELAILISFLKYECAEFMKMKKKKQS